MDALLRTIDIKAEWWVYPGMTTNSSTTFSKSPAWIWEFVGTVFENKIRIIGNQNGIAKGSNAVSLLRFFPTPNSHCVHSPKKAPLKHLLEISLVAIGWLCHLFWAKTLHFVQFGNRITHDFSNFCQDSWVWPWFGSLTCQIHSSYDTINGMGRGVI